jgi:uncharacterized protein DUF5309
MASVPLAKTGDSDRRQILAEYALVARNEKSSGGVFDIHRRVSLQRGRPRAARPLLNLEA